MKQTISKDEIEFRTLHDDEFDQIAAVFSKAFGFKVSGEKYKTRFKGGKVCLERQFVAVHRGKIVGGIRADYKPLYFTNEHSGIHEKHECGEINDVSTFPKYRRRGISRMLMNMAIEYMKAQGWELALLQANPKYFARDLYESVGFHTLKSTGELYHVSLGSSKARWAYFKILSVFFPVLLPLAKLFAPQPPRDCVNIPRTEHVEGVAAMKGMKNGLDEIGAIEIKGRIDRSHAWTREWIEGIRARLDRIQGLYDDLIARLVLDRELNEEISPEIVEKNKKNGLLKSFIENGGKRTNFIIFYTTPGENTLGKRASMQGMDSGSLDEGFTRNIIGGARFSVDFFHKGMFKSFIIFIDAFWLKKTRDDPWTAQRCMALARRIIGRYFPIAVCRAATGDLFLRDVLERAGYKPVAGGITMVMPIKNSILFERLERKVEPWILF